MKKSYLILALMIGFFLSVTSCKKQDGIVLPTSGKMQLPIANLVPGSQLITKSAGNGITQIQYEFWVKAPNATTNGTNSTNPWVLGSNALYKDDSGSQQRNSPIWTLPYPPTSYTFIEVPLNMETRVVAKGLDSDGIIKYYGLFDTGTGGWTTTNIPQVTINMYEIDSRLNINIDDLLLNRNFDFHFKFTGHIQDVNYDGIIQMVAPWLLNIAPNVRNFQGMPLLTIPNTVLNETLDILGAGSMSITATPTITITGYPVPNNNASPIGDASTTTTKNIPVTVTSTGGTAPSTTFTVPSSITVNFTTTQSVELFNIFELFHQGCSDFTTQYTIIRKDGYVVKNWTTINMSAPTNTTNFDGSNWCQAGYNFNIIFTADPQQLGSGVFTGTLTPNDNINGTVPL